MATIIDVRFEHYRDTLGVHESRPRISWRFNAPFQQTQYEIEVKAFGEVKTFKVDSAESWLVPWPYDDLVSRGRYAVRVRARGEEEIGWSQPAHIEAGLLQEDWKCKRISSPAEAKGPQPEDLFRKEFQLEGDVESARLYVTAEGVYEAEINGQRIGDHFLAPGWTAYASRLQYQTYDVTDKLSSNNCLGIRVAEGWCVGRMGFEGGRRNLWADRTSVWAQLEVRLRDGTTRIITTDESWHTTQGPIRLAEIYDGEKYDARLEVDGWSSPGTKADQWKPVVVLEPFEVELTSGFAEPVRRVETVAPKEKITTPSGKTILDFGQNLVGYVRIKVAGASGDSVTLSHAEVLDKGELGTRPLRICKAQDIYTLKGGEETYEPRFTFHGFRYVQIDGPYLEAEAVVCCTDMERAGHFSCSNDTVNQLFSNVYWSMRGNFLSVPTDCPQRDERLGWSGDLALFAPTATYIYNCIGMLKNWLVDVEIDQKAQGGIPAMVTPNVLLGDEVWGKIFPCAIWHDMTILAPWALWEETGDVDLLERQFDSMTTWLSKIPRGEGSKHLWDLNVFQLADWLDPNAPPDEPQKAATDPPLVANAFLIRCLELVGRIASIIGRGARYYIEEAAAARAEFLAEYVSPNGRLTSDSQTAYALAICFDLLSPEQTERAGSRLAEIVRKNKFKIGTGFAGTPYVCEALTRTGHGDVAFAMLLNEQCPSWLYCVTMGATTTWERWDSLLPDGSINPGDMTSFNHYAFGAVAKFMVERLAGLRCVEPGWKRSKFAPELEGPFTWAKADHLTPYGRVAVEWTRKGDEIDMHVTVPPTTTMEVMVPGGSQVVGSGEWSFSGSYKQKEWPVKPLSTLPF